jgi:predicted MFS family arabinose efflux permease
MDDTTTKHDEDGEATGRSGAGTSSIMRLVNMANASVGGLYLSTGSIAVTVIGAGLVTVLMFVLVLALRLRTKR